MSDPEMAKLRNEVLADVGGEVLEIGSGTSLSLAHYPPEVRRITTAMPNPGMSKLARRRLADGGIAVDQRASGGEERPIESGTLDCVVSTWTLGSIPEDGRAIGEVGRALRPGGRFIFLEHGLGIDPTVQRWQRRLYPLQGSLRDGCRLDPDISALAGRYPFADVRIDRFVMEGVPRTHGTMYRGVAVR
jgi:SAM-dependent methyltransferase